MRFPGPWSGRPSDGNELLGILGMCLLLGGIVVGIVALNLVIAVLAAIVKL